MVEAQPKIRPESSISPTTLCTNRTKAKPGLTILDRISAIDRAPPCPNCSSAERSRPLVCVMWGKEEGGRWAVGRVGV